MVQRLCIMLNTEKRLCINVTWSPGLTYGAKTVHYVDTEKRVSINVTWSPGLTYGAKTVHYVEYRKEGMYIEGVQMFL